jgi:hypothetical protein
MNSQAFYRLLHLSKSRNREMGLGGFRPKVNKEANLESLMEDIEMGKRRRRKVRRKRES